MAGFLCVSVINHVEVLAQVKFQLHCGKYLVLNNGLADGIV